MAAWRSHPYGGKGGGTPGFMGGSPGYMAGAPQEPPPCDNLYVTGLPEGIDTDTVKELFNQYSTVVQAKVLNNPKGSGKMAALVRFASVEEATAVREAIAEAGGIPVGLQEPIQIAFADPPKAMGMGQFKGGAAAAAPHPMMQSMQQMWNSFAESRPIGPPISAPAPFQMKGPPAPTTSPSWSKGKGSSLKGGGGGGPGKGPSTATAQDVVVGFEQSGGLPGGTNYSNDAGCVYVAGLPEDTTDLHLYRIFSAFGAIAPRGVRAMLHPDGRCRGFGFINYLHEEAAQAAIETCHDAVLPDGRSMVVRIKTPGKGAAAPIDGS
mmetsp:Transcript_22789/g.53191  ORF Transcript_22789/g.53191 Transcript_22789/m.53191 type:complete len:322 (-) Transcript_22789:65-1030(-)